jgi:hypothetical protein
MLLYLIDGLHHALPYLAFPGAEELQAERLLLAFSVLGGCHNWEELIRMTLASSCTQI